MTVKLLEVRGVSKSYSSAGNRIQVLSDVSLTLATGESLALMGRSGSGKSTLLNLLCGLELPDAGQISVSGQSINGVERLWADLRRRKIGVVFQDANLMPALSLLDNVRLRARLAGQPERDCSRWLERLGIGQLGQRYPDQVSGGQRQRAAMAMVFAMAPALILADEPTGSLDRRTADEVSDVLFRLQADTGCGLILATHDPELAKRCDRCLDLAHGTQV